MIMRPTATIFLGMKLKSINALTLPSLLWLCDVLSFKCCKSFRRILDLINQIKVELTAEREKYIYLRYLLQAFKKKHPTAKKFTWSAVSVRRFSGRLGTWCSTFRMLTELTSTNWATKIILFRLENEYWGGCGGCGGGGTVCSTIWITWRTLPSYSN